MVYLRLKIVLKVLLYYMTHSQNIRGEKKEKETFHKRFVISVKLTDVRFLQPGKIKSHTWYGATPTSVSEFPALYPGKSLSAANFTFYLKQH